MTDMTWEELLAKLTKETYIATLFEDEPEALAGGYHFGVTGDAATPLRSITDQLWTDYCIRKGHARVWYDKPNREAPLSLRTADRPTYHGEIEPAWRAYHVYLRDDATHTPLDLDKTLGELGLTERSYWVCFERAL